jgi:uncharacterized protein (DUF433 family)
VNGGRPCVASAGVSVHQVAILFTDGASPEEIDSRYEGLTLAGVYAALAHYFANRERIDSEIDEQDAIYEELRLKHPSGWQNRSA